MTNYFRRLIYVDDKYNKITPLFYPFLMVTLVYGLGFVAFNWSDGVQIASLYKALYAIEPWLPLAWGLSSIVTALMAITLLLFRRGPWGRLAALLGSMVWLFAGIAYLDSGFWLNFITIACSNGFFWLYYYFGVTGWERQKRAGIVVDPN